VFVGHCTRNDWAAADSAAMKINATNKPGVAIFLLAMRSLSSFLPPAAGFRPDAVFSRRYLSYISALFQTLFAGAQRVFAETEILQAIV
jgi:hypothetical protein